MGKPVPGFGGWGGADIHEEWKVGRDGTPGGLRLGDWIAKENHQGWTPIGMGMPGMPVAGARRPPAGTNTQEEIYSLV